jgi:hypothetical protein
MTANSPSPGAESASSTTDPDTQARRASNGDLSAGSQSDQTIDEDAVDGVVTAEEFPTEFHENRDDRKLYAKYRRLAAEQAALRRVATLVARGVEPLEVFGAVAEEMRRCVANVWIESKGYATPTIPAMILMIPEKIAHLRLGKCGAEFSGPRPRIVDRVVKLSSVDG